MDERQTGLLASGGAQSNSQCRHAENVVLLEL